MPVLPPDHPAATAAEFSDTVWLEVLSAVDRTYADLVDYQERLERQNTELDGLRHFLGSILASVSDILLVVDRSGRIEEVSASVPTRTGRSRADLIGLPVGALFADTDRKTLSAAMDQATRDRLPARLEAALIAPAGPTALDLSLAPRFDDRGRVAGMVLTGRNVGELRAAYAQLERSHDDLKSAQALLVRNEKLASLGRLLAGVAHELNNPISFVYANAHALERYAGKFETYFNQVQAGASRETLVRLRADLKLDREVRNLREAVQGARDGAERVRDIVADLRRLSSDGSGEMTGFDLVETTRVAATWVLRGSRPDLTVTFEGLTSVIARGRAGHIQQVVMNLVQNAVDALDPRQDGRITITHRAQSGMAVLEVADNGPGVPEEAQGTIFDPFFTTKTVGKGTGLGLSISHKIAEEHGGRLLLRQDPGSEGACFCLELPLGGPA
jgi:two-component system, NtrC family, sensor histidine kinase HupT/HoxJ